MTPSCALCGGELLKSGERIYRKVQGWERPGKGVAGKSGSSLVLREPLDEYAHSSCIEKLKLGIPPTQPSLLDDA